MAFVTLTNQPKKYQAIYAFAEKEEEIVECHHISGSESLILKIVKCGKSHLKIPVHHSAVLRDSCMIIAGT